MWPEPRAEDLFLDWLLALPFKADAALAAKARLAELSADPEPSEAQGRFCELLRQASLFTPPPPRRRGFRTPARPSA